MGSAHRLAHERATQNSRRGAAEKIFRRGARDHVPRNAVHLYGVALQLCCDQTRHRQSASHRAKFVSADVECGGTLLQEAMSVARSSKFKVQSSRETSTSKHQRSGAKQRLWTLEFAIG